MRTSKSILDHIISRAFFRESDTDNLLRRLIKPNISVSLSKFFAIPHFDDETEKLFWLARYPALITPMKSALMLGAGAFLAYILLDVYTGNTNFLEALIRLPIVMVLLGLFGYLQLGQQTVHQINCVAKLSAGLSAANLVIIMFINGQPSFYAETWPGLLPMYFFSYGQMLMSLRATIGFGWMTGLLMPLSGYWIGMETVALIPSILNLFIVNLFGLFTRYQLEAYSRLSFLEKRNAENSTAAKSEFLRQVCHNLGQPLQAMGCYASILDAAIDPFEKPELKIIAHKLGVTVDEFNAAFSRLLDIANLESGQYKPLLNPVDINVLLNSMEAQFAAQAQKRGIKLILHSRLHPPYTVRSDAIMLQQMLSNLIDNAIKYTNTGWVVIGISKISPHQLKLHIHDSGCGIPTELHQSIFREFFRGQRRSGDLPLTGLGIGLAYVASAINCLPEHKIGLSSKPNQGSHFQLYLPVSGSDSTIHSAYPVIDLSGQFALLVDDDAKVLMALAEQLRSWRCWVQTASTVAETLELLSENSRPPDLLICDYYLNHPETAHDIIAAVSADCGPIPTLIISARAIADKDKTQFPENTRLLRKPASAKSLMTTLKDMLGMPAEPF